MDDLRFYVLFNSVSVISGRWEVDNERLCAMELRLRLRRFHLERGTFSKTNRLSISQFDLVFLSVLEKLNEYLMIYILT